MKDKNTERFTYPSYGGPEATREDAINFLKKLGWDDREISVYIDKIYGKINSDTEDR